MLVDNAALPWSQSFRIEKICLPHACQWQANNLRFSPVKTKFFGDTNNIFSKLGGSAPINISLSLLYVKCVPLLTYGLESITLNKSSKSNLANVLNSMFFKVFKSFNKSIIELCQYYCAFHYYYFVKRLKFLSAVKNCSSSRVVHFKISFKVGFKVKFLQSELENLM